MEEKQLYVSLTDGIEPKELESLRKGYQLQFLISKEEYILNQIKLTINAYLNKDQMINPIALDSLIKQWSFDYDVEKEYRPEVLMKK
jgi:hypothetical protein